MIICDVDERKFIGLRWRDENGKRREKRVRYEDFNPYFWIKDNERKYSSAAFSLRRGSPKYNLSVNYSDEAVSLDGEKLTKVTWSPADNRAKYTVSKLWEETFEADVPIHHRYAVDKMQSIEEYDLRKWYWDMEWLPDDHDYKGAITCIVVYDNFGIKLNPEDPMDMFNPDYETEEIGKYTTYVWFPHYQATDEEHEKLPIMQYPSRNDGVRIFESEREMLEEFMHQIEHTDPDMLISWFGSKFDLPKLIERAVHNGIDARRLSPYGVVDGVYFNDGIKFTNKSYSPISQPIKGRITLNLDLAFERQWNDAQRGTLPSLALDYISENVLGDKKLVSEKFPDKNEFFARGWLEDTATYCEYAQKDVELLVRLDEENFTSEAIISLQRLIVAPFDACFYASHMGSIYFMRNAWWKAPSKAKGKKVDYQGAMIYNPESEATNGLHLGVAAFDFAGLYPSMMIARNISWETKSEEPTEFAVNIKTPRDFSECLEERYIYFKTDRLGLLPKAVLSLKSLRDTYKKKMYAAKTKEEKMKWNNNQMAVKRLMASFYGIIGYQGFGWADVDLAASITASAREAIREAAFKVNEL
tara:strand:+ start:547 stop:2304 length:1758 start_codon:yes stop_codon:yes gene_type:complete